ncbi:MAG: helix-turn-helix transcriptional regulator [Bacteroidetes bacterium]|nr:helix-turn-helix transcriptional regulator [Bacteroidota bacterium]
MKKPHYNYENSTGYYLNKLRRQYGLSQFELAYRADLSQSEISKLENNHAAFTNSVLQHLAKGFNTSHELLETQLHLASVVNFALSANNEESALIRKFYSVINSSDNENYRVELCNKLVHKLTEQINRKSNYCNFLVGTDNSLNMMTQQD